MGCLDGNCTGSVCKPDLVSPHFPPAKVGWRLVGWPDFVPAHFRKTYGENPVWHGNTSDGTVNEIVSVLKSNRIKIDKAALCAWANAQWCAAAPDRCKSAQSKGSRIASQRKAGLVGEAMLWATPFWRIWNVAFSDSNRDPSEIGPTLDAFVAIARHLVSGDHGCWKCEKHFRELLETYPPGKVSTWRNARVWLWRIHNESREHGRTAPYVEIATIYGWEELENAEVMRIVEEELRA